MISEERLRELVKRILRELEADKGPVAEKKIYMLCTHRWDDRFCTYLKQVEEVNGRAVYPVIPLSWKKEGYEEKLLSFPSCKGILYRSCETPADLETAVTVLPVVPKDVVVKTALCISDTFETSWIASCLENGGQVALLKSGLTKFTGKEPKTYVNQILAYYRQVLEYGITICEAGEESPAEAEQTGSVFAVNDAVYKAGNMAGNKAENKTGNESEKRKRVITASNVSQLAHNGILYTSEDDIITDMARDRAKFLNIEWIAR